MTSVRLAGFSSHTVAVPPSTWEQRRHPPTIPTRRPKYYKAMLMCVKYLGKERTASLFPTVPDPDIKITPYWNMRLGKFFKMIPSQNSDALRNTRKKLACQKMSCAPQPFNLQQQIHIRNTLGRLNGFLHKTRQLPEGAPHQPSCTTCTK